MRNPRPRRIALASRAEVHEERVPLLVNQILGGSAEALGELYIAFAEDVFRAAHHVLGSTPEAEDITSDVFLGLAATLQSYDHSSTYGFRRWLETITARRAAARAHSLAAAREVPLDSVRAPADGPNRPIDRLALDHAVATLTPALRSVFLLKAVEGYSHQEISAMLGIGVGASKVRLHRARKKLHSLLSEGA